MRRLTATLVPIQAVEGTPFSGTVARFTDANPAAVAADFTASILWGDGSAASQGTIVADGNAGFHVTGASHLRRGGVVRHPGRGARPGRQRRVGCRHDDSTKTQISGLQAPRVAYAGTGFINVDPQLDMNGLPTSFATGDLRGDGKTDLVLWTLGRTRQLEVLLGDGDGSFQAPMTIDVPNPGLSDHIPIALADFNGDGKLDIATDHLLFLGNGDGTFQAGKFYDDLPYTGGQPLTTVALVVADFNGDGIARSGGVE